MLKLKMLDVVIEKNYLIKTLPDLCKICKTAEVGMEEQNMQNHMKRNKIHAHRLEKSDATDTFDECVAWHIAIQTNAFLSIIQSICEVAHSVATDLVQSTFGAQKRQV